MAKYIFSLLLGAIFLLPIGSYAQQQAQSEAEPIIDTTQIMRELRKKERDLNVREADLNAKEARLNAMEQDLLAREEDVKKIRQEVTEILEKIGEKKNADLDNLVQIYSTAKPKSAANIMSNMDMETALAIFRKMKPNIAGKIMDAMAKINPTYASNMAEILTEQKEVGVKK